MFTLSDALDYALLGWSVIPCHHIVNQLTAACSCGVADCDSPGKHPRIRWTQYQGARPSAEELTRWLTRWPSTNVAVITGAVSGIVVLDVDPRHGGDESLRDLIAMHGSLPDTVRSLTGAGGTHYFFMHPGSKLQNSAGQVAQGIDVRGDGGFVVLPPSLHMSGQHYAWEIGYDPRECNVAPLPPWLLSLLLGGPTRAQPPARPALDIEGYLAGTTVIPLGERNHTMTRLAGYHVGMGEPEELVIQVLNNVYLPRCQQEAARPFGYEEIVTIVHSITRAEARRQAATAAVSNGHAPTMGEDELIEAARGLWAGKKVAPITRWVLERTAPDVVEYLIELPESEVRLGDNLLDQNRVRKALLNSDVGVALVRQKDESWTTFAGQLRRCAIEVQNGPRRQADQLTTWVTDWLQATKRDWIEVEPGARREFLNEGPCLIDGVPALCAQPFLDWITKHRYAPSLTMPGLAAVLRQGGWIPQLRRADAPKRGMLRFWAGPQGLSEMDTLGYA